MDWRVWRQRETASATSAMRARAEDRARGAEGSAAAPPTTRPASRPVGGSLRPIPSPIDVWLGELHAKYKGDFGGRLASYIPELTRADPAHFGIVLATADGQLYTVGDADAPFTIQSISKPFVYGLALEDHGQEHVLTKVGVEPTGEAFNSIVMDEVNNRPFNPMVNAGAIATTALVKGTGEAERFGRILGMFERFAGRKLDVDQSVFESEKATGHRNRAIAFLQLNAGMIAEPVLEHLDLYFRQCAILVTARDLAVMAATLANNGINPLTGERAIGSEHVKTMLSIMASCGMYDYSGEWVYRVGLPAKSGVGGGIIAVLPGQFGIGVFSPLLDAHGNSRRGIEVCKEISHRFYLHVYNTHFIADNIVRRSYRGGSVTSKRLRAERERKVLDRSGHRILAYELQGGLYFATAEQLLRRIRTDAVQTSFVILDARRIGRADLSALRLISDMKALLAASGITLVLAGATEQIRSDWLALNAAGSADHCFADVDAALEYCETRLIAESDPEALSTEQELPLGAMDILDRMTPEQITRVAPYLDRATFDAGDRIIKEGDVADRLYLLAAGSATVSVRLSDDKRSARMAGFRPGVAFGEFALFDRGRRVADVIADTRATCYVLTFAQLEAMEQQDPDLYQRLLFALGRLLSERLRRVTGEVRALS